jgi:hypothetical protein
MLYQRRNTEGAGEVVLRRIFGPKREKMAGGWRRIGKEEINNLYASKILLGIKSRRLRSTGHVAHMGEIGSSWKILVGKPERKRPLGIPRLRWEDDIRMDLKEIRWENVDLIHYGSG